MQHKKDIGNRIRFARERKGLQQKYVAKKLGIHAATLSKIELGFHEPDSQKIKIMADLYEVTPEWILFGEEAEGQEKLTEPELKVLTLFNQLSDEGKLWLIQTIEMIKRR